MTTTLSFLLIGPTRTNEAREAARLPLLMNTGGGLALLVGAWLMQHYHGAYALSDLSVGGATGLALAAAVVLLLYHAVSKALLFLAVGVVNEDRASEDIEDMYGLRGEKPMVALSIFIGVATLVLPPFGMFVSKWLISEATVTFPFLAFLLAIGFASIMVYYFKWLGILLTSFRGPRRPLREDASPWTYRWVLYPHDGEDGRVPAVGGHNRGLPTASKGGPGGGDREGASLRGGSKPRGGPGR